jgi:hypothetical protein
MPALPRASPAGRCPRCRSIYRGLSRAGCLAVRGKERVEVLLADIDIFALAIPVECVQDRAFGRDAEVFRGHVAGAIQLSVFGLCFEVQSGQPGAAREADAFRAAEMPQFGQKVGDSVLAVTGRFAARPAG